jgi:hypothetical protein
MTLQTFGKIALVAVFLCVAACSGGEKKFEPAPGASIEEDELQGLITDAVSKFDLTLVTAQSESGIENGAGLSSCLNGRSGPCQVPGPPSLAVALHGEDGTNVVVKVGLGVDSLEAGDQVKGAVTRRSFDKTETLRITYESPGQLLSYTGGPCDYKADGESDDGCAW